MDVFDAMCSATAFIVAGGEPIAPASRAPLSPKGRSWARHRVLEVECKNVVCAR